MTPTVIIRDEQTRQRAIERISLLKVGEEPWGVYVAPYEKLRTLEQNALYWRIVGKITDATGNSKTAIHEYLKREAFGVLVVEIKGKRVEMAQSSAKAKRGDFSDLIELAGAMSAEMGIPT